MPVRQPTARDSLRRYRLHRYRESRDKPRISQRRPFALIHAYLRFQSPNTAAHPPQPMSVVARNNRPRRRAAIDRQRLPGDESCRPSTPGTPPRRRSRPARRCAAAARRVLPCDSAPGRSTARARNRCAPGPARSRWRGRSSAPTPPRCCAPTACRPPWRSRRRPVTPNRAARRWRR